MQTAAEKMDALIDLCVKHLKTRVSSGWYVATRNEIWVVAKAVEEKNFKRARKTKLFRNYPKEYYFLLTFLHQQNLTSKYF